MKNLQKNHIKIKAIIKQSTKKQVCSRCKSNVKMPLYKNIQRVCNQCKEKRKQKSQNNNK